MLVSQVNMLLKTSSDSYSKVGTDSPVESFLTPSLERSFYNWTEVTSPRLIIRRMSMLRYSTPVCDYKRTSTWYELYLDPLPYNVFLY